MSLLIQEMIGAAERKLAVERQEIDRHWAAAKTMRASIGISRLTAIQPGAGERLVNLS